jgi:hypothetical protein
MTDTDAQIAPTLLERVIDYTNILDMERKRKLADFVGVQPQTVRQWQRGKSVPMGRRALQLHYLLEWVGYGDHQWRETNVSAEMVGRCLAFGLISDEKLLEAFKGECDEPTRITQILSGHKHITPRSQEIINDLADEFSWHVQDAQTNWPCLKVSNEKERLLSELATRLRNILPLVKDMVSDNWSEGDRYELRDRAGTYTVFELYHAMGALCGERMRQANESDRSEAARAALMITKE